MFCWVCVFELLDVLKEFNAAILVGLRGQEGMWCPESFPGCFTLCLCHATAPPPERKNGTEERNGQKRQDRRKCGSERFDSGRSLYNGSIFVSLCPSPCRLACSILHVLHSPSHTTLHPPRPTSSNMPQHHYVRLPSLRSRL